MRRSFGPIKFLELISLSLLGLVFLFLPIKLSPTTSVKGVSTLSHSISLPRLIGQPPPEISAEGVVIYDPDSKTVIYEKNSHKTLYPASTTKLVTALVSLEHFESDSILTVKNGGQALGNKIHLSEGDQFSMENLLYGLLVSSGNDAALTLAENYPGGYQSFISAMNQKVSDMGLNNTHFTNPSGVINANHYTTAYDLTLIAAEAIQNPTIRRIVATPSVKLYDLSGQKSFTLESTNKLLGLEGVKGLKTGWAPESGECLVTLVVRQHHPLIVTILNSTNRFDDTKILIDWAYQNIAWESI